MTDCKGIAGNIGLLRARVMLYDHNPFWARSYQNYSYPFSPVAEAQMGKDDKFHVIFQFDECFLEYRDKSFSNFVATEVFKASEESGENVKTLDIAKGSPGTNEISNFLPGGIIYNKEQDIFPHFLWIYRGSEIYPIQTVLNPSEYTLPNTIAEQTVEETLTDIETIKKLSISAAMQNGAAIWEMQKAEDAQSSSNFVFPVMNGRRTCKDCNAIHWTVDKFIPLYQGQDFALEFRIIDTASDEHSTQNDDPVKLTMDNPMQNTEGFPFDDFFGPSYSQQKISVWNPEAGGIFENGVSNEPFYINSPYKPSDPENKDENESVKNHFNKYYLKNKAYIYVEIGVGEWNIPSENPNSLSHNYFIEFVKGRNPRFLHFGYQYRGFDGIKEGENKEGKKSDIRLKVRELSEYPIPTDELLKDNNMKMFVRNHLGDIIITFKGKEDRPPWRITREDYVKDANSEIITKKVPMVVSNAPMRIHGGNMTMGFIYGPLVYGNYGKVNFTGRQAEIGNEEGTMADDQIYATFAVPGDNDKQISSLRSKPKRVQAFTDPQLNNLKMGYDCDSYTVTEIHKNKYKKIPVYNLFPENFKKFGKQWVNDRSLVVQPSEMLINVTGNYKKLAGGEHVFNLSGLDEQYMGPDGKHVGMWDVEITLRAGTHKLPVGIAMKTTDGYTIEDGSNGIIYDNVTPIATSWSLIVLGGGKVVDNSMTTDISEFVETISDGWSSDGYTSLNHETTLQLYLPITTGNSVSDSKMAKILSLADRSFFVTVAYWWENGMGLDSSIQTVKSSSQRRYFPYDDPRLIQMTGIAYGLDIVRSVNKVNATIAIKDYMEPLRQSFVFNCPFFDSVSDTSAIIELLKMAGFDYSTENKNIPGQQNVKGIDRRPMGYLQELLKTRVKALRDPVIYNEEKHVHDYFALPGSYADLNNPVMKFENLTPYKDILDRIVNLYGKTYYFDRYGVFIIEVSPAKISAYMQDNTLGGENDPIFHTDIASQIKAAFVTSPKNKIWNTTTKRYITFDSQVHTPFIVYNSIKVKRNVSEAINTIGMWSAAAPESGESGFLVKGRTFFEQIWNPEAEGFFGYRKMFWQSDGLFGDDQSMNKAMTFYARFKYPPLQASFETYGSPGLKPLDIIILDAQPLYITEINHNLDMKNNLWWMEVSGEWIKSFDENLLLPPRTTEEIPQDMV